MSDGRGVELLMPTKRMIGIQVQCTIVCGSLVSLGTLGRWVLTSLGRLDALDEALLIRHQGQRGLAGQDPDRAPWCRRRSHRPRRIQLMPLCASWV